MPGARYPRRFSDATLLIRIRLFLRCATKRPPGRREAHLRPVRGPSTAPCGLPIRRLQLLEDAHLSTTRPHPQYKNSRSRASWTTQSSPFSRLSPVMALQGTTTHWWVNMRWRSSSSVASCSVIPLGTSVLFRKTRRLAPASLFDLLDARSCCYGIPQVGSPPQVTIL
jgi:hypothetical protein